MLSVLLKRRFFIVFRYQCRNYDSDITLGMSISLREDFQIVHAALNYKCFTSNVREKKVPYNMTFGGQT